MPDYWENRVLGIFPNTTRFQMDWEKHTITFVPDPKKTKLVLDKETLDRIEHFVGRVGVRVGAEDENGRNTFTLLELSKQTVFENTFLIRTVPHFTKGVNISVEVEEEREASVYLTVTFLDVHIPGTP